MAGLIHNTRGSKNIWLYGSYGTGKTTTARAYLTAHYGNNWYQKDGQAKWWDGYCSKHKAVLWDEFRAGSLPEHDGFAWFLRLLDKYELRVERKHGTVVLQHECLVITSNRSPIDIFASRDKESGQKIARDEHLGQLIRRLSFIIHVERAPESSGLNRPVLIDETDTFYREQGIKVGYSETSNFEPADLTAFISRCEQCRNQNSNGLSDDIDRQLGMEALGDERESDHRPTIPGTGVPDGGELVNQ